MEDSSWPCVYLGPSIGAESEKDECHLKKQQLQGSREKEDHRRWRDRPEVRTAALSSLRLVLSGRKALGGDTGLMGLVHLEDFTRKRAGVPAGGRTSPKAGRSCESPASP